MGHFPAILKEFKTADSVKHIGGIRNFMQPLCGKLSEDEMDILGWISDRGWDPGERFCPECAELYGQGLAWNPSLARE